jgi:hypothetical protein
MFVDLEDPDEFEFGPIVEVAQRGWLLTLNLQLVDQLCRHAETHNLGLEYAGQLEYRFAERWSEAALALARSRTLALRGRSKGRSICLAQAFISIRPMTTTARAVAANWRQRSGPCAPACCSA